MDEAERDRLTRLHLEKRERLPMWVIYGPTTSDHPGKWVCRMHLSLPEPEVTGWVIIEDSLGEIRAALPYGLTCIGRMEGDDPVIHEVWL